MSIHRLLPFIAILVLVNTATHGRELAVAPETLVPVELATVALITGTSVPVVLLREPESGDVVPIFIGPPEARAILMALQGIETPRPMTHDLLNDVIAKLSGRLERVVVDDLRENTYHGALEVRVGPEQRLVRIDARPSDALALAVRSGAEIRVAPAVLRGGAGLEYEGIGSEQVVTALGITVVEATRDLRDAMELPETTGVLVSAVTGVAAYAGMRAGSLILSVNGETPASPMAFLNLVRQTPAAEPAHIEYWQDGQARELSLSTDVPTSRRGLRL